jgi:lipase chaperone LimK
MRGSANTAWTPSAEAVSGGQLAKVLDCDQLIAWFLDARQNEKEFILSHDPKDKAVVEKDIEQVLGWPGAQGPVSAAGQY